MANTPYSINYSPYDFWQIKLCGSICAPDTVEEKLQTQMIRFIICRHQIGPLHLLLWHRIRKHSARVRWERPQSNVS